VLAGVKVQMDVTETEGVFFHSYTIGAEVNSRLAVFQHSEQVRH
jgi:hypothetical protein